MLVKKVFLPKMTELTEDQAEKLLDNLQNEYGLSDFHIHHVSFWSASYSRFMGTIIDPNNKENPCSCYNGDTETLLKEHPDCEIYTLKGTVSLDQN